MPIAPAFATDERDGADDRGSELATLLGIDAGSLPMSDDGRARVILHLDVEEPPARGPHGGRADPAQARQSAAVATAQATARVTAALEDHHLDVEVARTFARVPYLAVSVDLADLPALAKLPGVRAVTPDEVVVPMLDNSVPQIGAAAPAPSYAGEDLDGDGAAIAVIDTGVETAHPFIGADRVAAEACFSLNEDCPNGKSVDLGSGSGEPLDGHEHGTHVAGIALGVADGTEVAQGVAPGAGLIAIQAFSVTSTDGDGTPLTYGSYISDLTKSLEFVLDQHVGTNGIHVAAANLSLGSAATTSCSTDSWGAFLGEVANLRAEGILTIAAAGNDGHREAMSRPACFPEVVGVGATDGVADIAWFSNLSEDTDLVAPGVGITSALVGGGFGKMSGTSMAAPHVAGAAALLRHAAGWANADELGDALRSSLTPVDDQRTDGTVTGLPLLDLPQAVTALPGADGSPGAPTEVTVVDASSGQAEVTWTAPETTGDSAITAYHVVSRPGGRTCTSEDTGAGVPTSCDVTGLTNGIEHTFTVIARNLQGPGPSSTASLPVTPSGPPGPPQNVVVRPSLGEIEVTWDPPADDGGSALVGYEVEDTEGALTACAVGADQPRTCTFDGLVDDTAYSFLVSAENQDGGWGEPAPATAPVIADGRPGPPVDVQASSDDARVTVSWQPPDWDGGSDITGYQATSSPGGHTCSTGDPIELTCTVTGLANGTGYAFTVTATNEHGESAPSDPTPATTPSTVPGPPSDVEVAAGAPETAVVSWTAPVDDGGSTILSSTVTSEPHGRTCAADGGTTTCTVTGLAGGQEYTFTVVATNARGDGPASPPSDPFVPESSSDGGGGGGGGSPPPDDDPIDDDDGEPEPVLDDDGQLPSLSPGTSELLVDGASSEVQMTSTSTSVTFSAGSLHLTLRPTSSSGASSGVRADATLRLVTGGGLHLGVDGLEHGSTLHGWLFSEPLLLGSPTASSTGTVDATVEVPAVSVGGHTLQLTGTLDDGRSVTFNLGVEVVDDVSFPDVDPDATHGEAILRLARLGIVTGFEDGTYRPTEVVTRGQMATFLMRALALDPGPSGSFPDVGGTSHDLAIGAIAEAEIAGGFPDGTYRPGAGVIRGQMATFLANGASLAEVADGPFSDVAGTTHAGRINAVAAADIAAGFDDGTFRPGRDVTRAQMASFVSRLLDHLDAAA